MSDPPCYRRSWPAADTVSLKLPNIVNPDQILLSESTVILPLANLFIHLSGSIPFIEKHILRHLKFKMKIDQKRNRVQKDPQATCIDATVKNKCLYLDDTVAQITVDEFPS